jgi:hypothetical protein
MTITDLAAHARHKAATVGVTHLDRADADHSLDYTWDVLHEEGYRVHPVWYAVPDTEQDWFVTAPDGTVVTLSGEELIWFADAVPGIEPEDTL